LIEPDRDRYHPITRKGAPMTIPHRSEKRDHPPPPAADQAEPGLHVVPIPVPAPRPFGTFSSAARRRSERSPRKLLKPRVATNCLPTKPPRSSARCWPSSTESPIGCPGARPRARSPTSAGRHPSAQAWVGARRASTARTPLRATRGSQWPRPASRRPPTPLRRMSGGTGTDAAASRVSAACSGFRLLNP